MATLFDAGLLEKFSFIFPFLFVLIVLYGSMTYSKFLGENKTIYAIISILFAFLTLASTTLREIINTMAPWFVILFIFIIFLQILQGFGTGDSTTEHKWIPTVFLITAFFILVWSVIDVTVWNDDTQTARDAVESTDVGASGAEGFFATLRHPSVLGFILVSLIAAFTIKKLTESG